MNRLVVNDLHSGPPSASECLVVAHELREWLREHGSQQVVRAGIVVQNRVGGIGLDLEHYPHMHGKFSRVGILVNDYEQWARGHQLQPPGDGWVRGRLTLEIQFAEKTS